MELFERFDKYLDLPREEAYNQYLDERNLNIFKVILLILAPVFAIIFTVNLADNESFNISLVLTLITLIAITAARIFYNKIFNIFNVRKSIFIFLVFQLLVSIAISITYPHDADDDVSEKKPKKEIVKKDSVQTGDLEVRMGDKDNSSFVQYILFLV